MAVLSRFLPSPTLSPYIEAFYLYEGDAARPPTKERCLPTGSMAVVVNLGHETLRVADQQHDGQFQTHVGSVFTGASSRFCIIDTSTLVTTLSVCFKPGGARPFLPLPAAELTNQVVDLSSLWGRAALDLREQLLAAQPNEDRVRLLEHVLLSRASWEQAPHPAVTFALATLQAGHTRRSIADVMARIGLSPKRFLRLFQDTVGLTPKVFDRVLRLQDVLGQIAVGPPIYWADLAVDHGYFDQAHFIHDFQKLSGLTPGSYLTQHGAHPNHVPLRD